MVSWAAARHDYLETIFALLFQPDRPAHLYREEGVMTPKVTLQRNLHVLWLQHQDLDQLLHAL